MAMHYFGRSDAQSLLDKILVRATTDMPLHERFARLSQIHSQRSSRKSNTTSSRHLIEPDEVRIQIRPFSNSSGPSKKRPASSMRSDMIMAELKASKISRVSSRSGRPGTMVMDRKPKSLSERMSGIERNLQSRSAIPSLMAANKQASVAKKNDTRESASTAMSKKKAVQRLGMQARLGAKTQSAKERLTLGAVPVNLRTSTFSNVPRNRFQKGGAFSAAGNQMNRKPKAAFANLLLVEVPSNQYPQKVLTTLTKNWKNLCLTNKTTKLVSQ